MSDTRYRDEEWLREQYVENGLSGVEIAEKCDISQDTAYKWIHKHDIKINSERGRDLSDSHKIRDPDWLQQEYCESKRSADSIAEELGVGSSTVLHWLREHNISVRSQAYNSPTGEDHPHWNGGEYGDYGKGWNEVKKRAVRTRDDHRCQSCGDSQAAHRARCGEKLHVHHLIKARDIDDPEERNAMENLITLCRDCHREWERVADAGIRPQIDGVTAD